MLKFIGDLEELIKLGFTLDDNYDTNTHCYIKKIYDDGIISGEINIFHYPDHSFSDWTYDKERVLFVAFCNNEKQHYPDIRNKMDDTIFDLIQSGLVAKIK